MTVKVSSLAFETLALPTEVPEPRPLPREAGIPINPAIFPNDWSVEVSLETRWLTDVAKDSNGKSPERMALSSRPTRALSVRIAEAGKEDAHAILQAALAHTASHGAPVPLYCDFARIENIIDGTRIFGDFRFRRFFVGGRVAIFPGKVTPTKASNSVIFATVLELTPVDMRVEFDPSTTRAPTPLKDVIAPCMDVEMVPSTTCTAQTDEMVEASISWNELEGSCTLPALWPPINADHSEVLAPIAPIVDGLAVFPFSPNWAEGVGIEPSRDIESDSSGRSTIQDPKGPTSLKFSFTLLGHDRERSWAILRFFDAMQGRAGTFWFLHPQDPWTLQSLATTSLVHINRVGDPAHLRDFFKRVALFRADGSFLIRKIANVEDITSAFRITLDSPLPDTAFVSVRPIHLCSFESDAVRESWLTDGVCSIEFSLTEIHENTDIGISNGIGYVQQNSVFLNIPGCNLLLRAPSGCSWAGQESQPWPSLESLVELWRDVSAGPSRGFEPITRERVFSSNSGGFLPHPPQVIRFQQSWQNNGQPTIFSPWFNFLHQLDTTIPVSQRHLWGPTGWTLLVCFTPQDYTTPQVIRSVFNLEQDSNNSLLFHIDRDGVPQVNRVGLRKRVNGVSSTVLFTVDIPLLPYTVYVTFHWTGDTLRAWVNGEKALAASGPFPIPSFNNYTLSQWFQGLYTGLQPLSSAIIRDNWGILGCANMVVSYNRPLTLPELETLHTAVSDIYRTSRVPATLY